MAAAPYNGRPNAYLVNDISLTKKLVAADVGISVVPEVSVTREMIEGRLVGIYPPWLDNLYDTLTWICSKDRLESTVLLHAERLLQRSSLTITHKIH